MASMTHGATTDSVPAAGRKAIGALSWFVGLCLALAALSAIASAAAPALVPFALAMGPAFIAVGLAWRERGGAVRRLRHSLAIRPARARWYLVLALPVALAYTTIAVAIVLGQSTVGLFDKLTPAALAIPLVVLLPAFAEELAWRGYALPRALAVMSPLTAGLVLAVPWTLMHLVLQLPGGMNEAAAVWPTIVSIFAYSVLLTWVYVRTGGSVLMTALVHTGLNGVVPLMWGLDPATSWAIRAVLAAAIAVTVVALGGLGRPSPASASSGLAADAHR